MPGDGWSALRRDPALGGLVALWGGVALALATSVGRPGVEAPAWSLAALVASAGIARRSGAAGAVAGAAAIGGFASAVLLYAGFPLQHDLQLHVWTLDSFGRAVLAGDWNPRWHAAVGLGSPLGLFYPPLPFWFGVPFYALGLTPAAVARGALMALHVAAAASMAGAVLYAGRGALAALFAGGAHALAPYLLFDLHGRGALGEGAALIFLPWLLAGVDRSLRGAGGHAGLAVAGLGLAQAHALALVVLAGALPPAVLATLALARGPRGLLVRGFARAAAVGALALGTGAHWLLPALVESDQVALATIAAGEPDARYVDYTPTPWDLVERRSVDHFAGSRPHVLRQTDGFEMPYYAGLGLLIAAMLGARGARARPGDLFASSLLGVGIALCIEPLAGVWGRVEPLARIQFPWRHLLVVTPAAAWLAGAGVARLAATSRLPVAALAGAALLVDALPYLGVPVFVDPRERIVFDPAALPPLSGVHDPLHWGARPLRCEALPLPPADRRLTVWRSYPAYPEYMTPELLREHPMTVHRGDRGPARRAGVACDATANGIALFAAAPLARRVRDGAGLDVVRVRDRGDAQVWELSAPVTGRVQLLTAAFPGFRARDGEGLGIAVESCDGWTCLDVAAPTREIVLSFGMTPVRRAGAWGSALAALVLAGLLIVPGRRAS